MRNRWGIKLSEAGGEYYCVRSLDEVKMALHRA